MKGEDMKGEDMKGEDMEGEDMKGEDMEGEGMEGEDMEREGMKGEDMKGEDMKGEDMGQDTDYKLLLEQLEALTEGEEDTIANLANAAAALYMNLADVNWAGFYLVREGQLVLGPFQGKPACRRIAFGKGVCGTAAETGVTQLVENVHDFPGHIACDGASNSEIVVPVYHGGRLAAVLDIDSPLFGRFTRRDKEGLEACAALLGRIWG